VARAPWCGLPSLPQAAAHRRDVLKPQFSLPSCTFGSCNSLQVYVLDGWDTPASTVAWLHGQGARVVCYFRLVMARRARGGGARRVALGTTCAVVRRMTCAPLCRCKAAAAKSLLQSRCCRAAAAQMGDSKALG
jgi:hypothetical protein